MTRLATNQAGEGVNVMIDERFLGHKPAINPREKRWLLFRRQSPRTKRIASNTGHLEHQASAISLLVQDEATIAGGRPNLISSVQAPDEIGHLWEHGDESGHDSVSHSAGQHARLNPRLESVRQLLAQRFE